MDNLAEILKQIPRKNLNDYADEIYEWCERKGWNENLVLGNMVCNLHTEISEAWEEIRNGRKPNELYFTDGSAKPEGFIIELIDLMIRVLHILRVIKTASGGEFDIDQLMEAKMAYNETRPYRHGNKIA